MKRLLALLAALLLAGCAPRPALLRVCADPNNLPFSNARGEGFENEIARMLAQDLGRKVEWTWWAQRRGFVRNTLKADRCDLWPGVASGLESVATTRPYYRSTYVFVTRADRGLHIRSLDDPRLKRLEIGVQMIGNDATNTPPAHALARPGIIRNVRGYMVWGDYARPDPEAAIIEAVERGDVDVAVVWGPLAGWFARSARRRLAIEPVHPWLDGPQWPMVFDISMGVRKDDLEFRRRLDLLLEKDKPRIDAVLARYGVPRVDGG